MLVTHVEQVLSSIKQQVAFVKVEKFAIKEGNGGV